MATTAPLQTQPTLDHRQDVQWLRALAVLVVLLYHLGVPGFAGGYVGVDVFFVLSGYLITRLLGHELQTTGSIDLRAFVLRRVRRLLPVSTLVLLVTVAWIRFGSSDVARLLEQPVARATGWFGANIALARLETEYLTAGRESSLQHFWSLAVEEQFYLVWPALLLGTAVLARRRGWDATRTLPVLVAVLGLASILLAARWTATSQPLAFFLLPARAWELLVGAALALRELAGHVPARRDAMRVLGVVAIAATTVAGTVLAFPWPLAVVPVAGTAALVWSGVRAPELSPAFRSRTMGWIGDRSYALYLWHWPPLVLLGLTEEAWTSRPLTRVAVVAGVFGATALTHRYVEEPLRHGPWLRSWRSGVTFLAVTVATTVGLATAATAVPDSAPGTTVDEDEQIGLTVEPFVVPETLPPDLTPPLLEAVRDRPRLYADGCHQEAPPLAPLPDDWCTYGDPDGDVTIALVGDSHAAMWFPALEDLSLERGWRLIAMTKSGCSLYAVEREREGQPYTQCPIWRERAFARLASMEPDAVVLGGIADLGHRREAESWLAEVRIGIERVRELVPDAGIMVPLEPAYLAEHAPTCLAEKPVAACGADKDDAFDEAQRALAVELADAVLDVPPLLCRDGFCPAVIDTTLVYRDASHLSRAMTRRLEPALAVAVDVALARR